MATSTLEMLDQLLNYSYPEESLLGNGKVNALVIPGSGRSARWIVPLQSQFGLSVLQQWRPFNRVSQLKWSVLLNAYKAGCLQQMPGVKAISLDPAVFVQQSDSISGRNMPEDYIPVVYIGTPTCVSKLVVSLVNPASGFPEQILKVPTGELARQNILHEASILEKLVTVGHGFTTTDGVRPIAPLLIRKIPDRGQSLQTVLSGKQESLGWKPLYGVLLANLVHPAQQTTLAEQGMQLFTVFKQGQEGLQKLLQGLEGQERVEAHERDSTLEKIVADFQKETTPLPVCWQHGDFSPWNMLRDGQRLMLVDWERSRPYGLPLQDVFHFLTMETMLWQKPVSTVSIHHPAVQHYLGICNLFISDTVQYRLLVFYFFERWLNTLREESSEKIHQAFLDLKQCWEQTR
jgi:hypothetical protein